MFLRVPSVVGMLRSGLAALALAQAADALSIQDQLNNSILAQSHAMHTAEDMDYILSQVRAKAIHLA